MPLILRGVFEVTPRLRRTGFRSFRRAGNTTCPHIATSAALDDDPVLITSSFVQSPERTPASINSKEPAVVDVVEVETGLARRRCESFAPVVSTTARQV